MSFEVSDQALSDALKAGIHGDRAARLKRMAKRSARFTHPEGNRRFHDFVLRIEDGVVMSVTKVVSQSV